jgi:hypothetical protein
VGWKGRFGFVDNNEWGEMAGLDLKIMMSGL